MMTFDKAAEYIIELKNDVDNSFCRIPHHLPHPGKTTTHRAHSNCASPTKAGGLMYPDTTRESIQ